MDDQGSRLVGIEYDGNRMIKSWTIDNLSGKVHAASHGGSQTRSFVHWLQKGFLPDGFPDSVTSDYLDFQLWDSLQALCSYIRGLLCSQAILSGIGVGAEAATPLSAVFQFFVRDLTGMLGGVLFAFIQGSELDSYAKQWRLFADIFNNVGYLLDLISPLFPGAFLLMVCLGSLARAVTGVAGGATRAALTQHFSKAGNAADISAKEGSQETATTLVGMIVGMALLKSASGYPAVIWAVFLGLTAFHIFANVKAMRALHLTSLNCARLDLLLADYITRRGKGRSMVLRPEEVAALEPLAPPVILHAWQRLMGRPVQHIRLGTRLSELGIEARLDSLDTPGRSRLYIVAMDEFGVNALAVLRHDAGHGNILEAYVHAYLLLHFAGRLERRFQHAEMWMAEEWPRFRRGMAECGWSLDRVALGADHWRAAWGDALHPHQS